MDKDVTTVVQVHKIDTNIETIFNSVSDQKTKKDNGVIIIKNEIYLKTHFVPRLLRSHPRLLCAYPGVRRKKRLQTAFA